MATQSVFFLVPINTEVEILLHWGKANAIHSFCPFFSDWDNSKLFLAGIKIYLRLSFLPGWGKLHSLEKCSLCWRKQEHGFCLCMFGIAWLACWDLHQNHTVGVLQIREGKSCRLHFDLLIQISFILSANSFLYSSSLLLWGTLTTLAVLLTLQSRNVRTY